MLGSSCSRTAGCCGRSTTSSQLTFMLQRCRDSVIVCTYCTAADGCGRSALCCSCPDQEGTSVLLCLSDNLPCPWVPYELSLSLDDMKVLPTICPCCTAFKSPGAGLGPDVTPSVHSPATWGDSFSECAAIRMARDVGRLHVDVADGYLCTPDIFRW
jgi:hypothetical protein